MSDRIARQAVRLFRNEGRSVDIAESGLNVRGRSSGRYLLRGVHEEQGPVSNVQRPLQCSCCNNPIKTAVSSAKTYA